MIHSHNNMSTFFSPTDISELKDNAINHNFYLSIVTNNKFEFIGKVVLASICNEEKDFTFYAIDEFGNKYVESVEKYVAPENKLIVYDCEIISPVKNYQISDNFKEATEKILQNKVITFSNYDNNRSFNIPDTYSEYLDMGIDTNITNITEKKEESTKNFALYIFKDILQTDNIEDVEKGVKLLKEKGYTKQKLSNIIMPKYIQYYATFFKNLPGKETINVFEDITLNFSYFIEDLELFEKDNIFQVLIQNLGNLVDKLYYNKKTQQYFFNHFNKE